MFHVYRSGLMRREVHLMPVAHHIMRHIQLEDLVHDKPRSRARMDAIVRKGHSQWEAALARLARRRLLSCTAAQTGRGWSPSERTNHCTATPFPAGWASRKVYCFIRALLKWVHCAFAHQYHYLLWYRRRFKSCVTDLFKLLLHVWLQCCCLG